MRRLIAFLRGGLDRRNRAVAPADQPIFDDLRQFICREVAGGYSDDDAVLRDAAEVFAGELEADVLRTQSQRYLRDALHAHREAQRHWPAHTDYDRLDAAFAALDRDGIVARQNFTCCGTCGVAEIWDEVAAAEDAGQEVRGYTFFHVQDTEAAVEYGGFHLNYGAIEDDDDASVAIGREVAATLGAHGLNVDWDGDLGKRIAVTLDWQRRR